MPVYVDEPVWPYGRMMMCHMVADTRDELLAMADRIGVQRRWIQQRGTPDEHFDIAKTKRALAVKAGAIEVPATTLVLVCDRKRARPRFPHLHHRIDDALLQARLGGGRTEVPDTGGDGGNAGPPAERPNGPPGAPDEDGGGPRPDPGE